VPASLVDLPVDARELQNRSNGPVDARALRQAPLLLVDPSEHSTNFRPGVHVIHEALDAVEDISPIGEADESLDRSCAIEFDAKLEIVAPRTRETLSLSWKRVS